MKPNKFFTCLAIALLFVFIYGCNESFVQEDSNLLKSEEFTFIPKSPSANQEVKMVYYGCDYNETSSVTIDKQDILVIKKFNGAMKRPCILAYDTISFGKLEEGSYLVTLKIIDINPFADDSIFHTETKSLRVF